MVNPVGMESGPLIDLVYTAANAGKASMGAQSPIDLEGYQALRIAMGPQSAAVMVRPSHRHPPTCAKCQPPSAPFPGVT